LEFLRGFLGLWWNLPRSSAEIDVHPLSNTEIENTKEQLFAMTTLDNVKSQKLLEKLGFNRFIEWTEPDTQIHRLGEPITLVGFSLAGSAA
jgi:hypothetical protein